MVRRARTLLIVLGLALGTGQMVFAQAQSASRYGIRPVSNTTNIQPVAVQPTRGTTYQPTGCNACQQGVCQTHSAQGGLFRNRPDFRGSMLSVIDRARLDFNRNVAWPHPFVQADREAYRNFLAPCLNRGWELQNTLSDDCFDEKSGRLNRLGASKIRNVVHAAPLHRKAVFVYASGPKLLTDARVKEVRSYLTYQFGQSNNVQVAITHNFPHQDRGMYAETMVPKYFNSLPKPVLDSSSVSRSVGN